MNLNLASVICSFPSDHKHIVEEPIKLNCHHLICRKCVPVFKMNCSKCGVRTDTLEMIKNNKDSAAVTSFIQKNLAELSEMMDKEIELKKSERVVNQRYLLKPEMNLNLESVICSHSSDHNHIVEDPVKLDCLHLMCRNCLPVVKINCSRCGKFEPLKRIGDQLDICAKQITLKNQTQFHCVVDPITLDCLHSMCKKCLPSLEIKCGKCGKTTDRILEVKKIKYIPWYGNSVHWMIQELPQTIQESCIEDYFFSNYYSVMKMRILYSSVLRFPSDKTESAAVTRFIQKNLAQLFDLIAKETEKEFKNYKGFKYHAK
jgi:hypothetical protein